MSYCEKLTKMLQSANQPFKKIVRGETTVLEIPVVNGGYTVEVQFVNSGKDFSTAVVVLDEDQEEGSLVSSVSCADDYMDVVNMVKEAPKKNGRHEELEDEEGRYIGLAYLDDKCPYGVVFVFTAQGHKFLGLFGF